MDVLLKIDWTMDVSTVPFVSSLLKTGSQRLLESTQLPQDDRYCLLAPVDTATVRHERKLRSWAVLDRHAASLQLVHEYMAIVWKPLRV